MARELNLSGYKAFTEVLAQRSKHGTARQKYVISLPLYLINAYLPVPDPETPFPGNRRVNRRHAEGFGDYWRQNESWIAPPLLIDTTLPLQEDFTGEFSAGGVEFGVLRLRQNSANEFDILDGQHRILGWKIVGDKITEDLKSYRLKLQRAREQEDEQAVAVWQAEIDRVKADLQRYESEYVTLEIVQGLSPEDHRVAFNDIATNALGITKSVTVSFDRRSLINRVAVDLGQNHELIGDRIDWEKDRIVGRNEHMISGRNLADIVRHVVLGIDGRMTSRRESEMSEGVVEDVAEAYLDALVQGFPQLQEVKEDQLSVLDLREREMTLSSTILRVLAGVFHNLAVDFSDEARPIVTPDGFKRAVRLYSDLSSHMAFPLEPFWLTTGVFEEGAKAPGSRSQDLKQLTKVLTNWGNDIERPF